MSVEEVGHEGEIELRVAGDEGCRGEEFPALEFVGVVEDLFGALEEVAGLKGTSRAKVGRELVEKDGVVFAVFDIVGEVCDARK
jgi:hypothetical protein